MPTFPSPYHMVSEQYPESSTIVQFGKGYRYASAPQGLDQIIFTLDFPTLKWYYNSSFVINRTINPTLNMAYLIDFYETQKMWKYFDYNHPARGTVRVRFQKPLVVPKSRVNGAGWTEPFQVSLILEP